MRRQVLVPIVRKIRPRRVTAQRYTTACGIRKSLCCVIALQLQKAWVRLCTMPNKASPCLFYGGNSKCSGTSAQGSLWKVGTSRRSCCFPGPPCVQHCSVNQFTRPGPPKNTVWLQQGPQLGLLMLKASLSVRGRTPESRRSIDVQYRCAQKRSGPWAQAAYRQHVLILHTGPRLGRIAIQHRLQRHEHAPDD